MDRYEKYTDAQMEARGAKQNRRLERHEAERKVFELLNTRSSMRFKSTPRQMRAAAKKIVMRWSAQKRKAALAAASA